VKGAGRGWHRIGPANLQRDLPTSLHRSVARRPLHEAMMFPLLPIVFWVSVVGAVIDWRYVRRGGQRPTRADWRRLAVSVLLAAIVIGVLLVMGGDAGVAGSVTSLLTVLIFWLWEFRRWLTRWQNPIPKHDVSGRSEAETP
jgi:O-antigen/teichoic acid export membrane protein